MRAMLIAVPAFVYICGDIAVNHGASVRGWVAFFSSLMRSIF